MFGDDPDSHCAWHGRTTAAPIEAGPAGSYRPILPLLLPILIPGEPRALRFSVVLENVSWQYFYCTSYLLDHFPLLLLMLQIGCCALHAVFQTCLSLRGHDHRIRVLAAALCAVTLHEACVVHQHRCHLGNSLFECFCSNIVMNYFASSLHAWKCGAGCLDKLIHLSLKHSSSQADC